MSDQEKREILERVAALPQEDQRNLAFFVAGMAAKEQPTVVKQDPSHAEKTDAAC